tara:strand:+ start:2282 stop:3601 length:1320 start_codon:yes stop_codon:yes gene_type:complete
VQILKILKYSYLIIPCLIAGQNYALYFDGSNDYVSIPGLTAPGGSNSHTLSAWMKRSTTNRNETIAGWGNDATNQLFDVRINNNKISWHHYGSGELAGSTTLSANTWYHIVASYDGTTQKLYVNGSLDGSQNRSLNTGTGNVKIGRQPDWNGQYFYGFIDEVAIWDEALTASEVSSIYASGVGMAVSSNSGNYTSSSNLIGYWQFQQNLNDTSSGSNNGTFSGGSPSYSNVSSDLALPVEITSFQILHANRNGIRLEWVTGSEIDNLGFILDRKKNSTDWIQIASYLTHQELQGQGTVSHHTTYGYTDRMVSSNDVYDYRIADIDYAGNVKYHFQEIFNVSIEDSDLERFQIHQNYPNPYNSVTAVDYYLPRSAYVKIRVVDMLGNVQTTLVDVYQERGNKTIYWNSTNEMGMRLPSGIYFYQMEVENQTMIRKMILLK